MHTRKVFLLIIVALLVGACGGQATQEKTKVSFQLSWTHEYSASPLYMAIANNHFAENNLDVSILEGGFDTDGNFINSIQVVVDGKAQFGTTDSDGLIRARADGQPLVAIATVTQRSPFCVISLADKSIVSPQDLVGKTVAVNQGSEATFKAFLNQESIAESAVTIVPRESFGLDPITGGTVDAMTGWIVNEGQQVREQGMEANILLLSDYGINTYDFLIFTTEDMISKQPDAVQGFVTALQKGMQDVVDNPDKAAEVALTYNESLKLEEQQGRLQVFVPLMNPAGSRLGVIDPNVFTFNIAMLTSSGVLTQPVEVEKLYNAQFINEVYAKES